MRFAADQLRDKALLALEEAVQEARYGPVRRTMALRFALAYLWAYSGLDRAEFDTLWRALAGEGMWRFSGADQALSAIYRSLKLKRNHDVGMAMWKRQQEREP
jgi:hypothetical protein